MGVAAPRHQVGTVMPSGAIGCWGRMPSRVATSRDGRWWMSAPSSSTVPPRGLSRRASPRSSVDLPQALAPTMTVTASGGIVSDNPSTMTRSS